VWMPKKKREPDFNQLLTVLNKKKPDRPVLWEFFLNDRLYDILSKDSILPDEIYLRQVVRNIIAYKKAGYDFAVLPVQPMFTFADIERKHEASVSMNQGFIHNKASFESFQWPSISSIDMTVMDTISDYIPEGMKLIPSGPGGVEENVIEIMGYETLCYLMLDDPDLVKAIFDKVGSLLCSYYELICSYPSVGACLSNDDWAFNTQPLISPQQMETYLYPWHRKISAIIHEAGMPAILHSCGNLYPDIMETVIEDLKYDAKHSYEDSIKPVEEVYREYGGRIAILGGIDLDFLIQKTEEEVYKRATDLLAMSEEKGGYALGTGNSVPDYVPDKQYMAMLKAFHDRS